MSVFKKCFIYWMLVSLVLQIIFAELYLIHNEYARALLIYIEVTLDMEPSKMIAWAIVYFIFTALVTALFSTPLLKLDNFLFKKV